MKSEVFCGEEKGIYQNGGCMLNNKRRVFCNKRGVVVLGVGVLIGLMLVGLVLFSAVVRGGILDAMNGVIGDNGIETFQAPEKLDKKAFNDFLDSMKNANAIPEDEAIRQLLDKATPEEIDELAGALEKNEVELQKILNAYKGKADNPKIQEFAKQLAIKKSGKTGVEFNTEDFKGGSFELSEDTLKVKGADGKDKASISLKDIQKDSKISVDKDGNVKVSIGDVSITTDSGVLKGLEVLGVKNKKGVEFSALAVEGGVTIKDGVVIPAKDAEVKLAVGTSTSIIKGLTEESKVNVLGGDKEIVSASGNGFSIKKEGKDGYSAEVTQGAIGTKDALKDVSGPKAVIGKKGDVNNVDFSGGKKNGGVVTLKPESGDWTYTLGGKTTAEGGKAGSVPPASQGGMRYNGNERKPNEVEVKRDGGWGSVGSRVVTPKPKPTPPDTGEPIPPGAGGSSGSEDGGKKGTFVEAVKAVMDALTQALAGMAGGEEGGESGAVPSSQVAASTGSQVTSPSVEECVPLGKNGDGGFGKCPNNDCTNCQRTYSGEYIVSDSSGGLVQG